MDLETFIKSMGKNPASHQTKDIAQAWQAFTTFLSDNPQVWADALQDGQKTQLDIIAKLPQGEVVVAPAKGDRRFAAPQWQENAFFSYLMQSYLANSEMLRTLVAKVDINEHDQKIMQFVVNQYIDAMAPTNFPATNPEVIEESVKTNGQNLVSGMQNFLNDMQEGLITNTDRTAFTIGDNIALSEGKVIFQNHLFQLIEYAPRTPKVHAQPLLIVPPCINKYYILDLTHEKSFVRHLVENEHRVFLMSWVNAGDDIAHLDWDDYMRDGVMTAIEAVCKVSQQPAINTLGFCIGGTLLVSTLAALAANDEHPASSITMLASMLDFSDTGEIGLFINKDGVRSREKEFANGGIMDGRELARGFSVLRPNDLIWPYVINNYYHGKDPAAFDLLFWNSDPTNLPGRMFARYLRMTYLENQITNKKAVMCGEEIVPSSIKAPVYAIACEKDHIVPWRTAYNSAVMIDKNARFVLAASGHIAGIINPPSKQRGWFHCAPAIDSKALPESANLWQDIATRHEGSWWQDYISWLNNHSGKRVPAPKKFGNTRHAVIEDAPGHYVSAPRPLSSAEKTQAAQQEQVAQVMQGVKDLQNNMQENMKNMPPLSAPAEPNLPAMPTLPNMPNMPNMPNPMSPLAFPGFSAFPGFPGFPQFPNMPQFPMPPIPPISPTPPDKKD